MTDPKLDLSRAPRIADMINAWFCPQCGLRDETARGIDQDGTCSSCGSDCCTWDSVRGHLAHYGWEVVSADDARGARAEAAEARERRAVRQVYAVNSRLRAEKAAAKSVAGEAVALLERWNKLSMPTCEELQSDTCDFLYRIRSEAPKENGND